MSIITEYQQRVTRANPGCIIFLLDHSYSMTEGLAGTPRPKCEAMSMAINRFLSELIIKCEKGEDLPYNYFDIGVIAYTTDKSGTPIIGPALHNALSGRDLVSVVELYENPLDIERRTRKEDDGAGGLIDIEFDFPVWYKEPHEDTMAGTPMCGALDYCHQILQVWCDEHPGSFPPVVIHLTDGESTDGDPEASSEALRSLCTDDGGLLLFNCHLSTSSEPGIVFPTAEGELPDEFGRLLFRMSSTLPSSMTKLAEEQSIAAPSGARGMVFNADGAQMLMLISVGTVIADQRNLR